MVRRLKNWGNIRGGEEDERVPNRGLVPRGYDNMGPFNEVIIGPAGRNAADVEARDHDIQYGEEEAVGVTPHLQWVDADEEFLQDLQPTNWKESLATGLFSAKKAAKNIGLVRDMSGKNKRKKPIRMNPWEEGDDFRERREARAKRREDNLNTRIEGVLNPPDRDNELQQIEQYLDAEDMEQERFNNEREEKVNEPTTQQQASLVNLPGNEEDDEWWNDSSGQELITMAEAAASDDPMGEEVSARSSAGGGQNPQSKETPISRYPTLTYGLQETHTTILPFTFWFSSACDTTGAPAVMKIRLNSIYDFITSEVETLGIGDVPVSATNYSRPISPEGKGARNTFPESINNGTAVETPYWRNYWAQLYEYYTVLGCEYKITTGCVNTSSGFAAILGHTHDSWSDTATESGNITPTTNLSEAMSFKGMQFDVLRGARAENEGQQMTVIQRRYIPGQAKRNIVNDGDVKTWTKTAFNGTSPENYVPTLKETLNLYFWRAPLANIVSSNTEVTACNTQVELKWIVQFKDLRNLPRYPSTIGGTSVITNITNNRTDIGNPIARWA